MVAGQDRQAVNVQLRLPFLEPRCPFIQFRMSRKTQEHWGRISLAVQHCRREPVFFSLWCQGHGGGDKWPNNGPDGPETGAYRLERVVAVAGLTVVVDKKISDSWLDSQWSEDSTQNRHRYAMDMRYIDWGSLSKRSPFKTSAVKRLSVHLLALPAKTRQKEAFAQSHCCQKYLKMTCKVCVVVSLGN